MDYRPIARVVLVLAIFGTSALALRGHRAPIAYLPQAAQLSQAILSAAPLNLETTERSVVVMLTHTLKEGFTVEQVSVSNELSASDPGVTNGFEARILDGAGNALAKKTFALSHELFEETFGDDGVRGAAAEAQTVASVVSLPLREGSEQFVIVDQNTGKQAYAFALAGFVSPPLLVVLQPKADITLAQGKTTETSLVLTNTLGGVGTVRLTAYDISPVPDEEALVFSWPAGNELKINSLNQSIPLAIAAAKEIALDGHHVLVEAETGEQVSSQEFIVRVIPGNFVSPKIATEEATVTIYEGEPLSFAVGAEDDTQVDRLEYVRYITEVSCAADTRPEATAGTVQPVTKAKKVTHTFNWNTKEFPLGKGCVFVRSYDPEGNRSAYKRVVSYQLKKALPVLSNLSPETTRFPEKTSQGYQGSFPSFQVDVAVPGGYRPDEVALDFTITKAGQTPTASRRWSPFGKQRDVAVLGGSWIRHGTGVYTLEAKLYSIRLSSYLQTLGSITRELVVHDRYGVAFGKSRIEGAAVSGPLGKPVQVLIPFTFLDPILTGGDLFPQMDYRSGSLSLNKASRARAKATPDKHQLSKSGTYSFTLDYSGSTFEGRDDVAFTFCPYSSDLECVSTTVSLPVEGSAYESPRAGALQVPKTQYVIGERITVRLPVPNIDVVDTKGLSTVFWLAPTGQRDVRPTTATKASTPMADVALPASVVGAQVLYGELLREGQSLTPRALSSTQLTVARPLYSSHWNFTAGDLGDSGDAQNKLLLQGGARVEGDALHLKGKGASASVSSVNNLVLTQDMTLATWVYVDEFKKYNGLMSQIFGARPAPFDWYLLENGIPRLWRGDGRSIRYFDGRKPLSLNTWHHVAVVVGKKVAIHYLDGKETARGALDVPTADKKQPLRIGARTDGITEFNGYVDGVFVTERAFDAGSLQKLMEDTRPTFVPQKKEVITVRGGLDAKEKTIIAGSGKTTLATFIIESKGKGATVTGLDFSLAGTLSPTALTSCAMFTSQRVQLNTGAALANPSTRNVSIIFDAPMFVAPMSDGGLYLLCDVAAGTQGTVIWNLKSVSTDARAEGALPIVARAVTVVPTGSLAVRLSPESPLRQEVIAGTRDVLLAALNVNASAEPGLLQQIGLTLTSGNPSDLLRGKIYDGATLVGTFVFTGGSRYATTTLTRPVMVPRDATKTLLVKVDLAHGEVIRDPHPIAVNWSGYAAGVGEESGAIMYARGSATAAPGAMVVVIVKPPVVKTWQPAPAGWGPPYCHEAARYKGPKICPRPSRQVLTGKDCSAYTTLGGTGDLVVKTAYETGYNYRCVEIKSVEIKKPEPVLEKVVPTEKPIDISEREVPTTVSPVVVSSPATETPETGILTIEAETKLADAEAKINGFIANYFNSRTIADKNSSLANRDLEMVIPQGRVALRFAPNTFTVDGGAPNPQFSVSLKDNKELKSLLVEAPLPTGKALVVNTIMEIIAQPATLRLRVPAQITFTLTPETQSAWVQGSVGLYRKAGTTWQKVEPKQALIASSNYVSLTSDLSDLTLSGTFAVMGERQQTSSLGQSPVATMLCAIFAALRAPVCR